MRMKILFITKYSPDNRNAWGGEIQQFNTAKAIRRLGHEVVCLNSADAGEIQGIPFRKCLWKTMGGTPYYPIEDELEAIVKDERVDIVQHIGTTGVTIERLRRKENLNIGTCNIVATARKLSLRIKRDMSFLWRMKPFQWMSHRYERFCARSADVVMPPSNALRNYVREEFGVAATRIETVPNFIDLRELDSVSPERGVRYDGKTFVFAGRIVKEKGLDQIVRALATLGEENSRKFKVLILGEGPEKSRLQRAAGKLGVSQLISFRGRVAHGEVLRHLVSSFGLVIMSEFDPFPTVVLEAMTYSKPVIGSNSGGIPEMIENGFNGYLVAPRDYRGLAQAMMTLADDPRLARRMGENGRGRVQERYTADRIGREILAIYEDLTKSPN